MSDAPTAGTASGPSLSYVIGRLDRAIRTRLGDALAPHELTIAQFTTLSVLARRPGLSNAQLARRALITPQSMIQVISGLEQRALVSRTQSHGRTLQTRLTPAGDLLLKRAQRDADAVETAMVAGDREPDDAKRAIAMMLRWSEALSAMPVDRPR